MSLQDLIEKMPPHYYVCEKALWVGNVSVDIDHIGNDLSKPLDYEKAFTKMLVKLNGLIVK